MENVLVQCAVCGTQSRQRLGPEVEPEGPPDTDTRPAEPLRSTILTWLERCPECGYAAPDISAAEAGAAEIVRAFQPPEPVTETPFVCFAHLLQKLGAFADAGWTALHAAWVADDEGRDAYARLYRQNALRLWRQGKRNGEDFGESQAMEFAVVTDVYRRAAAFDEARETALEALELEDLPAEIEAMLRRQLVWIAARDSRRHTLDEVSTL